MPWSLRDASRADFAPAARGEAVIADQYRQRRRKGRSSFSRLGERPEMRAEASGKGLDRLKLDEPSSRTVS